MLDSELDFDDFVTVDLGENEHLRQLWAPDVNSDSSDTDRASVAMSLTATLL